MEHTKEPWRVGESGSVVSDTPVKLMYGSDYIEYYGGHMVAESVTPSNARRIVACVNACEGIPTEHLEVGPLALATLPIIKQRDQLLSTMQDIANSAKYLPACKAKDEILAAVSGVID